MFSTFTAARLPAWAVAGLCLTAWPAQAQPAVAAPSQTTAIRADPTDPKAPVPAALYASPLRTYQRFAEPTVAPWRDTNEAVRQRGGWREYAREGRELPARDVAPPAAGVSQPAASGHSDHKMK